MPPVAAPLPAAVAVVAAALPPPAGGPAATPFQSVFALTGELPPPLPKSQEPAVPYVRPDLGLLHPANAAETVVSEPEIEEKKRIIQEVLDSFAIDAQVTAAVAGPRVTLFEVDPAPGVKVENISRIGNNLAMELAAVSLRILAPVPGQRIVGIEVPNQMSATVHLRRLLEEPAWAKSGSAIPLPVGRNIRGANVVLDLAKAPHLLIAGATGSGKSVCMNSFIMALLFRFTPEDLQLILIDPKVVEFSIYGRLPHLIVPVINDVQKVVPALNWVIAEMARRYRMLAAVGARNLDSFNKRTPELIPPEDEAGKPIPPRLPFIVVIIDELADIMMQTKGEVANSLARIAQLSRAVGIHTIVATQRPSVNVITGTIKANYPTRIAFQVSSQIDARTILDSKGAESLLGRGDMLFKAPGGGRVERVQAPMVDDGEIEAVVNYVASQGGQKFNDSVFKPVQAELPAEGGAAGAGEETSDEDDELIERATEVIVRDRRATTSYIQRRLRIGYNRAASLMELLEKRGIIGPQIGTGPREILINDSLEEPDDTAAADIADEAENG